jgi:hypothetical protein
MSAKTVKRLGFRRGGDRQFAAPEGLTVIGADITAADLKKHYAGNVWSCKVIQALVDRRAEKGPPPAFFWKALRGGVNHAIHVVSLGIDTNGKEWIVVAEGRNRTLGLREVNIEREKESEEPLEIEVQLVTLPRAADGIAAALKALDLKITSNVHVPMAPSDTADRVMELSDQGLPPASIAHKLGLREEVADVEIPQYLALAKCVDEVRTAVDTGTLALAKCIRLAKKSEDQQRAAVAPKERKPREQRRTLPGEFAKAWAEKLPETFDVAVAALKFMGGDLTALDEYPTLKSAAEKAGLDFETGRVKRAEK